MSEWLSDRREISLRSVMKTAERLGYEGNQVQVLLKGLSDSQMSSLSPHSQNQWAALADQQLEIIEDPIHDVLLEFTKTSKFRNDLEWISKRLKKPLIQVKAGFERLERAGLLKVSPGGQWQAVHAATQTTTDIPSKVLRSSHRKKLTDAISALDEVPIHLRDVTSVTFKIDPEKIPLAKEMIREFRRNLATLLSAGRCSEVYELNIQLLPKSFHCNENVNQPKKIKEK